MEFTKDYLDKHEARKNKILASHVADNADQAWHTRRLFGLGGSDMGIVLGVNHYQTLDALWRVKTGREQPSEGNQKTYWGHVLEDVVAREFAVATGMKVQKCNKHFCSKDYPFLVGNIDRFVSKETELGRWERYAILECKTAGAFMAKNFSKDGAWYIDEHFVDSNASGITKATDIPMSYYLQCQHYMYVTGVHRCYLAVLIGGNDYRIYVVNYRQDEVNFVIGKAIEFWCHNILDDVEPTLTADDIIKPIFQTNETKVIGNVDPVLRVIAELQEVTEDRKALEKKEKELKGIIATTVGTAAEMTDCSGTRLCTFKVEYKSGWDVADMKAKSTKDYNTYMELKERYYVPLPNKTRTLRII